MLDDIKKTLWATADKLRANMDAAEYKHLVLGLIFIKYISDSFEAHKTSLTQRLRNPDDELFYGDASDEDIAAELEDRDYFTAASVFWVPERNLAVELLERLLQGEIKSRFASNVVQDRKFSDMLADVIRRYQNRSIETAQVMEELIEMARKFREAAQRGESLGLHDDELKFYDALANNESAVRELQDETLKKIAQELTASLRANLKTDWSERESVRAQLRLMVRRILRKYKYPPDQQDEAVKLVLEQAQALGVEWTA